MRRLIQIVRDNEGAEIAEAALVLPVVFLFLLGIIWFGRAFNIYSTIQQAAQQGALTAARATCATCTNGNTFAPDGTISGPAGSVAYTVATVMQASNLDPTLILSATSVTGCTSPSNITICRQVLLSNTAQSALPVFCSPPPSSQGQICGVQVSFQYPFQFYLPFTSLNLTQVILGAQAQSRMEN